MTGTSESGSRRRWWGLIAISLGVALIIVDTTIVNVAIPSLIADLKISSSQAQWVQEAYAVVFAALLLVAGRIADTVGARRVFLAGVAVFTAASVLAALAPTGDLLVASRFIQGAGGAAILPTSLSLINSTFRGRERGQAFAIWGSTIGAAAALGPLLGGWLTTDLSWRWAFGINIPLGVAIAVGMLVFLDPSPRARVGGGFDSAGVVLSVIGFGGLAFGLIEGRTYGWWSLIRPVDVAGIRWSTGLSPIPVVFALALAALIGLVAVQVRQRRRGRPGLIDLDLFSIDSFRNGNIASSIISLGEFGLLFALPLWLQNVLGYTAFQTGLVLLALAVGSFAASGIGAVLAERVSPLGLVRIGIALEIVGVAGIGVVIAPTTPWWALTPLLLVYGAGVGFATAQVTNVVLADVPVASSGSASGLQSAARQVGSAMGIAVLGTVLFSSLSSSLRSGLRDLGLPAEQVDRLSTAITDSAGAAITPLAADPATRAAADVAASALSHATSTAAYVAAGALVLGFLASLRIRSTPSAATLGSVGGAVIQDTQVGATGVRSP